MPNEWVVLELTTQGEDEDPEVLRSAIKRALKGSEIFIPASVSKVGESRVVHKLIDNYVFVRRDQPDAFYLKIEDTRYVLSVLTTRVGKVRKIASVRDADISKMRRQITVETEQGINVDDEVEIVSGAYKGIKGKVIEEIKENDSVQVYINLRSKQTIVTLPRSFLKYAPAEGQTGTSTFAPFLTKVSKTQEYLTRAQALLHATRLDVSGLLSKASLLAFQVPWVAKIKPLVLEVMGIRRLVESEVVNLSEVKKAVHKVDLLHRFNEKLTEIEDVVHKAEKNAEGKSHN